MSTLLPLPFCTVYPGGKSHYRGLECYLSDHTTVRGVLRTIDHNTQSFSQSFCQSVSQINHLPLPWGWRGPVHQHFS